jgi:hypothetical protein
MVFHWRTPKNSRNPSPVKAYHRFSPTFQWKWGWGPVTENHSTAYHFSFLKKRDVSLASSPIQIINPPQGPENLYESLREIGDHGAR